MKTRIAGRAIVRLDAMEIDLGPHAAADPVALHVLDRAGPVDVFEVVEQAFRIGRDPQHPLGERHADDGEPAALALAVDHFFIGEDGAELRAPVDRDQGPVGQPPRIAIGVGIVGAGRDGKLGDRPALPLPRAAMPVGPLEVGVVPGVMDLQEDPLRPPVIAGVGRIDLAIPVIRESQRLDLAAEGIDVGLGGDPGMRIGQDGILLGGQAVGVPAHRVQDVEPAHPFVAAKDVGRGIALRDARRAGRRRWGRETCQGRTAWAATGRGRSRGKSCFVPTRAATWARCAEDDTRASVSISGRGRPGRAETPRAAGRSVDKKSPPGVRGQSSPNVKLAYRSGCGRARLRSKQGIYCLRFAGAEKQLR